MKEQKSFRICPQCNASVRDINLDYHLAKSHGIGSLEAFEEADVRAKRGNSPGTIFIENFVKGGFKMVSDYAKRKGMTYEEAKGMMKAFSKTPPEFIQALYAIEGLRNSIIMEYALLRRDIGLMDVSVSHLKKTISIVAKGKDDSKLIDEYIREGRFIDFARKMFLDKKGVKPPEREDIDSKSIQEAAGKLQMSEKEFMEGIRKSKNKGIFIICKGAVFAGEKYQEFTQWFEGFSRRYDLIYELADLVLDQEYKINMDGEENARKIFDVVLKEIDETVKKNVERIKASKLEASPLKINDISLFKDEFENILKTGELIERYD